MVLIVLVIGFAIAYCGMLSGLSMLASDLFYKDRISIDEYQRIISGKYLIDKLKTHFKND